MQNSSPNSTPYGPFTNQIRRFLVELSSLELDTRKHVTQRFESVSITREFEIADASLGDLLERSGRVDARDAVAGPLLQLVRGETDDDLDPVAEAALAALLALMMRDLLAPADFDTLYSAFMLAIPTEKLA